MCYYTWFVVHCQFSHKHIRHWEIFLTKNSFVFVKETATSTQILRMAYGNKICSRNMAYPYYTLLAVRLFFVISPLFRSCSQIVYSGLKHIYLKIKFFVCTSSSHYISPSF